MTRVYDAPIERVWDAWTDPAQTAQWWGPRGFTLTTHNKDLRPGGIWHYTMHGPDGTDWPNKTFYLEVEPLKKLVYDHGGYDDRPPLFRVTVLFSFKNGQTTMDMTMALATAEAAEQTRKLIRQAGGNATWDRLAEYLGQEQAGKNLFVINRSFNAPRELLYEMWTNPEHVAKWLPPTGMDMRFLHSDIRPGGGTFWMMTNHVDLTFYGRAEYLEMSPPERIVYTQEFCDREGEPSRHPQVPLWPARMLTIVDLTVEGPDQTRVTVTWEPIGNVTAEELRTFLEERAGMTQGWTGSFDKLESLLEMP
jgi:uncharacterized protein YndB with AHSA1/START domain